MRLPLVTWVSSLLLLISFVLHRFLKSASSFLSLLPFLYFPNHPALSSVRILESAICNLRSALVLPLSPAGSFCFLFMLSSFNISFEVASMIWHLSCAF